VIQSLLAMPRVIGRCIKVALVCVEQVLCCWRGVVGEAVHRNFLAAWNLVSPATGGAGPGWRRRAELDASPGALSCSFTLRASCPRHNYYTTLPSTADDVANYLGPLVATFQHHHRDHGA